MISLLNHFYSFYKIHNLKFVGNQPINIYIYISSCEHKKNAVLKCHGRTGMRAYVVT